MLVLKGPITAVVSIPAESTIWEARTRTFELRFWKLVEDGRGEYCFWGVLILPLAAGPVDDIRETDADTEILKHFFHTTLFKRVRVLVSLGVI